MAIKQITGPVEQPVTLDEAKAHLRVMHTADDLYIGSLIASAVERCQNLTGRALMAQTWEKTLDAFPAEAISLPRPPVLSVVSVRFIDTDGVERTIDPGTYLLDNASDLQVWLLPAYGRSWPATRSEINAVKVRFIAGYVNAASVPQPLKNWILLAVGELYEHRERSSEKVANTHLFVDHMLDAYRVDWGL
jgi:uncharacterized phiE125 gp8 family phage protein